MAVPSRETRVLMLDEGTAKAQPYVCRHHARGPHLCSADDVKEKRKGHPCLATPVPEGAAMLIDGQTRRPCRRKNVFAPYPFISRSTTLGFPCSISLSYPAFGPLPNSSRPSPPGRKSSSVAKASSRGQARASNSLIQTLRFDGTSIVTSAPRRPVSCNLKEYSQPRPTLIHHASLCHHDRSPLLSRPGAGRPRQATILKVSRRTPL